MLQVFHLGVELPN